MPKCTVAVWRALLLLEPTIAHAMFCAEFNALYDRQAEYASAYLAGMVNALGQYGDPDVLNPDLINFDPNALNELDCVSSTSALTRTNQMKSGCN
jgi:hypothetical protein